MRKAELGHLERVAVRGEFDWREEVSAHLQPGEDIWSAFVRVRRERDEARAEVERLRIELHDARTLAQARDKIYEQWEAAIAERDEARKVALRFYEIAWGRVDADKWERDHPWLKEED